MPQTWLPQSLRALRSHLSPRVAVVSALALLPLIYFYPAVLGHVLLAPGDGWDQTLGVMALMGRMLASGEWPLWNPYIFAGTPLLASVYPGALYPPNWLFAVLPLKAAMNIVVLSSFYVALVGSYFYARRIGIERLGSLVTGMVFAFSAYMVSHVGHPHRLGAAAWMPWIMLAVEGLAQSASWRASYRQVMLGALAIAMQTFAGEAQMNFHTALTAGAYVVCCLLFRELVGRRRFVLSLAMMATLGTLLSLPHLLPAIELLRQSERAQLTYEYFSMFSVPPQQWLMLIFPYFFGGAYFAPYRVSYWGAWWVGTTCSFVGVSGLLLGLVAVLGGWRKRLAWFWAGVAAIALFLALGYYLPFDLNHLLFRLPGFNLFRGSYRHLAEFSLAAAVLAGMGVNALSQQPGERARRALRQAVMLMAALAIVTLIVYCFSGSQLVIWTPRPANAASLINAEALIPIGCLVLGATACWFFARRRTAAAGVLLAIIVLTDLATFGEFAQWRTMNFDLAARLADPPAVKWIKEHERDLNAFRILSEPMLGYTWNYDALNEPNISIIRGLQSTSGYDVLRLPRFAAVAGEMDAIGVAQNFGVFGSPHQGLNLLNVKYLLRDRRGLLEAVDYHPVYDGLRFHFAPLRLKAASLPHEEKLPQPVMATELALVSAMGGSTHLPEGQAIARIKLHTTDGQVIEREVQAGRDTAEWAYDRADVRATIKHQRPRVVESWQVEGFQGHNYLSRFAFDRAEIARIEFEMALPADEKADFSMTRASLHDAVSGQTMALDDMPLPEQRWARRASFGLVDVYENLQARPRAWFVTQVRPLLSVDVLRTIKEGKLPGGQAFDPAETALLETEDFGGRAITLPPIGETTGAAIAVTRYEPHRIEITTRNPQPGFLVLSEVYYRGWDALVDGVKTPVYRANYVLRGIALPPGDHKIEFIFRAPSFRLGAIYAGLGAVLLIAGAIISQRSRKHQAGAQTEAAEANSCN